VLLRFGHFGKCVRSGLKVLKCGAGERCGRSVESIVRKMKNYYMDQKGQECRTFNEIRKPNRIGHILHMNCLLKHVIEGKIEGRIKATRRRGRGRKQLLDEEGTVNRNRKHQIALCGELALDEAVEMS